jgi:midasin
MKLKMNRYLDGFPFGYYLVVGDVRELPGVLATALRQWFAEVVDAAG